ncbi:MAG: hypothetical protein IT372_14325 [Polyangiaceae bacterium]|nr:hypothetical protein [Polyangiaceae bacterium]
MSTAQRCERRLSLALALTGALLAGCEDPGAPDGQEDVVEPATDAPEHRPPLGAKGEVGEACDPLASIKADGSSLIVTDPAVLVRFPIERVLGQIIALTEPAEGSTMTPEELLQRIFDTENATAGGVFPDVVHCDSPDNQAFFNAPPADCPRAEGALASSHGLFVSGDKDHFAPVALVNRGDLMPDNLATCGEYRIIYAKHSGHTDPNDRVFLAFEAAPVVPGGGLMRCRAPLVAWESAVAAADGSTRADILEELFFEAAPSNHGRPIIHPDHFGRLTPAHESYARTRGQVRIAQRMQDPWSFREVRLVDGFNGRPLVVEPVRLKNNPDPSLFEPPPVGTATFAYDFELTLQMLAQPVVDHIGMRTMPGYDMGESAVGGPAAVNYEARAGGGWDLTTRITSWLAENKPGPACPPGDDLTAAQILRRATTQTCAGCHAPELFLGPGRKIGCGLSWPASLGRVHIEEDGSLSPALTEVFLPRRAALLSTYLKGCDVDAIKANLLH